MRGDTPIRRAAIGAIGAVLLLSLAALMLRAAGGAYADDYTLTAHATRSGFNLDDMSTVKIRGVTVGGVDGIALRDDGTVEITLKLRKEVRVPETATARIEPLSVFGPKFVDIIPGPDEGDGPFLDDGGELASTVAPSEVVETLEEFADVLQAFDGEKFGTILGELARGVDGLGDELGDTISSSDELTQLFMENREEIDRLLADSRLLGDTLATRGRAFVRIAERSATVLDLLTTHEDELADMLGSVSQMSSDLANVVDAAGDDVGPLLDGLDRVSAVLLGQLSEVPTFLRSNERIFRFLGEDLIQWDIGDGRLGAVTRAVVVLDPCIIVPTTPGCGVAP